MLIDKRKEIAGIIICTSLFLRIFTIMVIYAIFEHHIRNNHKSAMIFDQPANKQKYPLVHSFFVE